MELMISTAEVDNGSLSGFTLAGAALRAELWILTAITEPVWLQAERERRCKVSKAVSMGIGSGSLRLSGDLELLIVVAFQQYLQ